MREDLGIDGINDSLKSRLKEKTWYTPIANIENPTKIVILENKSDSIIALIGNNNIKIIWTLKYNFILKI
jgi:hypothetical protein